MKVVTSEVIAALRFDSIRSRTTIATAPEQYTDSSVKIFEKFKQHACIY